MNFIAIAYRPYTAFDSHVLFRLIAELFAAGDLGEIVAAPALYHHQQVKGLTVLGIVGFKIIVRIGHKTLQFTGEQKVGHDCTGIVGQFLVGPVAHGNGDMLHVHRRLELKIYGFERLVFTLQATDGYRLEIIVVMIDEEQTIGQQTAVLVEDDEIVDACREKRGVEVDASATTDGLKQFQYTATENCHSKTAAYRKALRTEFGGELRAGGIEA